MSDVLSALTGLRSGQAGGQTYSSILRVRRGHFGDPQAPVHTFLGSVQVAELVNDVEVFEDVVDRVGKNASGHRWPVSRIIQREIDGRRLPQIKQYIAQNTAIKYFPPLTLVILPLAEAGQLADSYLYEPDVDPGVRKAISDRLLAQYGGSEPEAMAALERVVLDGKNEIGVRGYYVFDVLPALDLSLLVWEKSSHCAVVIDGQHRLRALQAAHKENPQVGKYWQDVVVIDISQVLARQQAGSSIDLVRRVFIDINDNAQSVSNATKYVMDDKDLASRFVQALVDDNDHDGSRAGYYILPQLVNWHTIALKHELPHITSILVLYQLMSEELLERKNVAGLEHLSNLNRIRQWIEIVNGKFRAARNIREDAELRDQGIQELTVALEQFRAELGDDPDAETASAIFTYDYRNLRAAEKTFRSTYAKAIVAFFTELEPYSELIDFLNGAGVFDPTKTISRLLTMNPAKRSQDADLVGLFEKLTADAKAKLEGRYGFIYTVVAQKALFKLFARELMSQQFTSDGEALREVMRERFIRPYNRVLSLLASPTESLLSKEVRIDAEIWKENKVKYGSQRFWEGIVLDSAGAILYKSSAQDALAAVLTFFRRCVDHFDRDGSVEFDEIDFPQNEGRILQRLKTAAKNQHDASEDLAEVDAKAQLGAKSKFAKQAIAERLLADRG